MKNTKKFKLLFVVLGLMLVLVACGGKDAENKTENKTENSKETTKTYKSENLDLEFNYNSNFNEVEDLSQVELLKDENGTSYDAEGIEVVLSKENEEAILIASEDSNGSTIEELKSSIDEIKALFDSISTGNELEYSISANEIIEISGSKMLKTELTTSGVKTYMLSFIKDDKLVSIQYVAKEGNYSEENIKTVTESLKI